MPSRKIEQQLEILNSVRDSTRSDATLLAIRKVLRNRVNLVVAKAAAIAAHLQARAVVPDLLQAFDRFCENAAETDPKCWAKEALCKALRDLGHDESAAFLRGLRHVQMEPIWGTTVDTAATLRGTCALALLQCTDLTREDKLWHVMRALTDRESTVRTDAARALGELSGVEAALLLRLKARMGDREPAVTGQVLEAVLDVEGNAGVPFVAEFLTSAEEELREEAALALGASRLPAAMTALIEAWTHRGNRDGREAILRGLSASRQESALNFLLDIIRQGSEREALAALDALQLHRDSVEISKQVAEAVASRRDENLQKEYLQTFRPKQSSSSA
jgi:HEAT repeat protein